MRNLSISYSYIKHDERTSFSSNWWEFSKSLLFSFFFIILYFRLWLENGFTKNKINHFVSWYFSSISTLFRYFPLMCLQLSDDLPLKDFLENCLWLEEILSSDIKDYSPSWLSCKGLPVSSIICWTFLKSFPFLLVSRYPLKYWKQSINTASEASRLRLLMCLEKKIFSFESYSFSHILCYYFW